MSNQPFSGQQYVQALCNQRPVFDNGVKKRPLKKKKQRKLRMR